MSLFNPIGFTLALSEIPLYLETGILGAVWVEVSEEEGHSAGPCSDGEGNISVLPSLLLLTTVKSRPLSFSGTPSRKVQENKAAPPYLHSH